MRFLILPILSVNCRNVWPGVDVSIGGDYASPGFHLHGLVVPDRDATFTVASNLSFMYTREASRDPVGQIRTEYFQVTESYTSKLAHVACYFQGKVFAQSDVSRDNTYIRNPNILNIEGHMDPELICSKLAYMWNRVSTIPFPTEEPPVSPFHNSYTNNVELEVGKLYYFTFTNSDSRDITRSLRPDNPLI